MRILVVGASRGIGAETARQALEAGHEVTAFARHPENLAVPPNERLRLVAGDVLVRETVGDAVRGQEAVVLTLGSRSPFAPTTLFSQGTAHVLQAMREHGVGRLVCVTGIGAGDSRGHGGFVYDRLVLPILLGRIYADKERQEALIRSSDCEWVIVRPGFLTNGPLTGKYAAHVDMAGVTAGRIARADVAHFILAQLGEMSHRGKTPLITY